MSSGPAPRKAYGTGYGKSYYGTGGGPLCYGDCGIFDGFLAGFAAFLVMDVVLDGGDRRFQQTGVQCRRCCRRQAVSKYNIGCVKGIGGVGAKLFPPGHIFVTPG